MFDGKEDIPGQRIVTLHLSDFHQHFTRVSAPVAP